MPQLYHADLTVRIDRGFTALGSVRVTRFKEFHRIVHHQAVKLDRLRFI